MNRNKYKILVLTDLKNNSKETIEYAISIAKEIDGALELLCVKKPLDFITTDNPLSAMRNVSDEFIKTAQKAKNIINSITTNNFFPVKNNIAFGNVKNEIDKHIQLTNPDFIIIGKKQKKFLNITEDNVTTFVLKKYNDCIFTANKTTIPEIYAVLNSKKKTGQIAS